MDMDVRKVTSISFSSDSAGDLFTDPLLIEIEAVHIKGPPRKTE